MQMKSMYVYILKCSDGSFYTGVTSDPGKRFFQHHCNTNTCSYLEKRKPFELVFLECFSDPQTAIAREKQIKRWSRSKKQALVDAEWENLKMLSRCMNETHFSNMESTD